MTPAEPPGGPGSAAFQAADAAGQRPALPHLQLGRLLTRVERDPACVRELLAGVARAARPAEGDGGHSGPPHHRIGVTGSPGVGKSTLLGRLIRLLRGRGERVAVVAVDPTSPLSGGALLGDRLRLAPPQDDPGLFIRSLASRGSPGGVTPAAGAVAALLEAAGYTTVFIETVGVGQTGYDVACLAETVLALFSPEGGDALQFMKAGLLEIGDVLAVNKADRPGADTLVRELESSVGEPFMAPANSGGMNAAPTATWTPPVLPITATSGDGVDALLGQLDAHRAWLASLPPGHPRRLRRIARELAFVVRSAVDGLVDAGLAGDISALARQVQGGELDFWAAAEQLRARVREKL